jgi:large exoprotein involved in heme utilization and adhesion
VGRGIVGLAANSSLSFAEGVEWQDITISDEAFVSSVAANGGAISLTGQDINILDDSVVGIGINGEPGSGTGQAGDLLVQATGTVRLDDRSQITNLVFPGRAGTAGNLHVSAKNLLLANGAQLASGTFGEGNAGNVNLTITETAHFDGVDPISARFPTAVGSIVGPGGSGTGGNLYLSATNLLMTNGAELSASTFGQGNAGNVALTIAETALFEGNEINGSFVGSQVNLGAIGTGGSLQITATNLEVTNGAELSASTFGQGDAGNVVLVIAETARFDGADPVDGSVASFAGSQVEPGAVGTGGSLQLMAKNLEVTNGAELSASTLGEGNAGNVVLTIAEIARFDGVNPFNGVPSFAGSTVALGAVGQGGNLQLTATNLEVTNGALLSTGTFGEGDGGNLVLMIAETARFDGVSPLDNSLAGGAGSQVALEAIGQGGNLQLTAANLEVNNRAFLASNSLGIGDAGNIELRIQNRFTASAGRITTSSQFNTGGQIDINASNILLEGNSDIETFVLSGAGGGGNITINADFIIALDDSDILAFAEDGTGGNITLQTPAFFGQNFTLASLTADPDTLDGNDRVDINATGAVAGLVTLPNISFVENSLNDLTDNIVVTSQLLAGSCIARAENDQGSFVVTGGGGLPTRPSDNVISTFATGEVQAPANTSEAVWSPGEPIVEPTGAFELASGRLVLSRECESR